jgi:hypothetical protein
MDTNILNVGDTVNWKGSFGLSLAQPAKITGMEWCKVGSKEGRPIKHIDWDKANSRQLVVDLDNGHWAYGTQLSK